MRKIGGEYYDITNKKHIELFLQNNPQYADKDVNELKKIVDDFFSYCADSLIQSKYGIILNGLGYFSNAVFKKRNVTVSKTIGETLFNHRQNGNLYVSYFFPKVLKNNPFTNFSFKLKREKARAMKPIIDEGMEYKCYAEILERKVNKSNSKYYHNDK